MKITENFDRLEAFATGPFEGLCTPAEFAEIQGIDESAVRHAIRNGRLIPGKHCLKFGKQWVLCSEAFRVYNGNYAKISNIKSNYYKAIKAEDFSRQRELLREITRYREAGQSHMLLTKEQMFDIMAERFTFVHQQPG